MSAMYRLKAYFGMVPADEMDFVDEPEQYAAGPRGGPGPQAGLRGDRWAPAGGRFADPDDYAGYAPDSAASYDDGWSGRPAREASRPARAVRADSRPERDPIGLSGGPSGGSAPAVRGALAMDPESLHGTREPVRSERPVAAAPAPQAAPTPVPEQRDRAVTSPATITTLQPRSYHEARTIGERYREGVPVIINLTELEDAVAKRLVDFAAGLAFALRGSMDKVTSRVFLLTPADIEVSADDARRLAERGTFRQD